MQPAKELAAAGIDVTAADSLEVGLEALQRHEPDALVVNIDVPGLDGHALCEVIDRENPARSFEIFVVKRLPTQADFEWTETFPDLRMIQDPVTLQKLSTPVSSVDSIAKI